VAGVLVALLLVALGGYFAVAGMDGQPGWSVGADPDPTEAPDVTEEPEATETPEEPEATETPEPEDTPEPTEPTEPTDLPQLGPLTAATAREHALVALAADDLVWTIAVWGFPHDTDWQDLFHTTTDGSLLHMQAFADGDIFIESLMQEVDGLATDTAVYHTGQTWYTQTFPLDSEGITPFTSTIPVRLGLLRDLIDAADPMAKEDYAIDQAVWCYSVPSQSLPAILVEIGGIEATICLDQATALPVRLSATYDNQTLRSAYLNPSNHNYLNLPEMLTHQWGDCWAVDVPDHEPPPGTCHAAVTWLWSHGTVEDDPLHLVIPQDYRQVPAGELATG